MSEANPTAAPEQTPDQGLTDQGANPDPEPEPYTLQVFLLRGDPDSDPTEVAGDAWQFDASDDDEATIAALETLATEFGGEASAAPPGQAPSQPGPGQGAPAPPGGPGPGLGPGSGPGQPPGPVPGQQPAPPGGPPAPGPGQAPPA